jgi:hypothetical protein
MALSGQLEKSLGLTGGTDNTEIGNVSDSLKVYMSGGAQPVTPANQVVHVIDYLRNGSSRNMNINGSITPVVFTYTVPANETWYAEGLRVFMSDSGTMAIGEFGSLGSVLTNGLLIEFVISSTSYQYANIKTNEELAISFIEGFASVDGSSGFLNTNKLFMSCGTLDPFIRLNAGDQVKVTVQDNLSGLDQLFMALDRWKVLA